MVNTVMRPAFLPYLSEKAPRAGPEARLNKPTDDQKIPAVLSGNPHSCTMKVTIKVA